jgi:GrpB-like predicted nucleotidyltransferase (UPF0157 family)
MNDDASADVPEYLEPRAKVNGPVQLVQPDPAWPTQFAELAARIRTALGPRAISVAHVGSTSVPGLLGKPVIDILLVVPDSADESAYVPALDRVGWTLHIREPGWHEHRLLKRLDPRAQLHVFGDGCPEIDRMVGFRDWLRTHPDDLAAYARLKQDLAAQTWAYVQDYADAKSDFVEEILSRSPAD